MYANQASWTIDAPRKSKISVCFGPMGVRANVHARTIRDGAGISGVCGHLTLPHTVSVAFHVSTDAALIGANLLAILSPIGLLFGL